MGRNLLIHENIPQPSILQTNNRCHDDSSFNQMVYVNPGIDKWVGVNYIIDYMKLQNNIELNDNTLNNVCQTVNLDTIKYLPENTVTRGIKLSNDNINIMSGCEFNNDKNTFTGNHCLETMKNINEDINENINIKEMTNFEKGYLFAFTILVVGLLYKANYKINYKINR